MEIKKPYVGETYGSRKVIGYIGRNYDGKEKEIVMSKCPCGMEIPIDIKWLQKKLPQNCATCCHSSRKRSSHPYRLHQDYTTKNK